MSEAAKVKAQARVVARQRRLVAEGKCRICTKPRHLYLHECDECYRVQRLKRRKRNGNKPWQPGRAGQPPYDREVPS